MELALNTTAPQIMHIDLNSCFATLEQQANPLLRSRPIAVAAHASNNGCILAPSIEAKQLGVRTGMRVRDAKVLAPRLIVLEPDPPKYRYVHKEFLRIFESYSDGVIPLSIDEAVIDFHGAKRINSNRELTEIGREIKQRLRLEIGEWISCNVGLGPNRFMAKVAASLHKPDGMDVITSTNLEATYNTITLIDLPGINHRYTRRLNAVGITTPLEFLNASLQTLTRQVFHSINGYYWYARLRGWEVDTATSSRRSYSQSYALSHATNDTTELSRILLKLCEKMARRLRASSYKASGVSLWCSYRDSHWHQSQRLPQRIDTTQAIFSKILQLLTAERPDTGAVVTKLAISCFNLSPALPEQPELFGADHLRRTRLSRAMDLINNRYGEYTIAPARMMGTEDQVIDRIAFGK
jgi:DNA polymerase-4